MKTFLAILLICPVVTLCSVECPDGTYCNDGNTCCALQEGGYGCCPMPSAVCCSSDKCCPEGNICLTIFGMCIGTSKVSGIYISLSLPRTPSMPPPSALDIPCPGGWSCSEMTTCCGDGCCPYRNAVCCNDNMHCCPSGYQCDVGGGQCVKSNGSTLLAYTEPTVRSSNPSRMMTAAFRVSENKVMCSGDEYFCPEGNTCCNFIHSQWNCCPFPNAVCCKDHKSCCPNGFKCDNDGETCLSSNSSAMVNENAIGEPTVIVIPENEV